MVIPNAELFIYSVTVNTAFEIRRWEYELSTKAPDGLPQLKALLADTISKVDGVLFTPVPEALVIDLGDPDGDAVNLQLYLVDGNLRASTKWLLRTIVC
ncbi:MAG: hypothetical protein WAN76_22190 [Candidatus Sulfotelmatobacter sp.]